MTALALEVAEFTLDVGTRRLRALNDVDLCVGAGEIVGLIGESGSGKSLAALSIAGLLPKATGHTVAGAIRVGGVEGASRRAQVGFIFQEPMSALNPALRIDRQLVDAIRARRDADRATARQHAATLLAQLELPDPERVLRSYPHQLSGGMRQRVVIALALSGTPSLLIADEPTTALDVTVQLDVLRLIRDQARERNLGVLLITHDVNVVAYMAARLYVMYGGWIVEAGPTAQVLAAPRHPYTRALLASRPDRVARGAAIPAIDGFVPPLAAVTTGCRFADRCALVEARCHTPSALTVEGDVHIARCWKAGAGGSDAS
ncbi:ABC transporter ATP-binding protein [Roseiterribacter gracilis]|uniref:Dipeptide/oligopeptide/nickel ABC transporter ATP-binding protein n=1 Tax=Roseiterribacter gracilis TaxID=2812848 RepID=A0A8S8X8A9_9PROT|nr:dipeptide/oligopeptide/nickel ABC transporter ATP-binding protein [Rhodospirillales bacterium TMPK1]